MFFCLPPMVSFAIRSWWIERIWPYLKKAMPAEVAFSGWIPAAVSTVVWGLAFWYFTVRRPAQNTLSRTVTLISKELAQNFDLLSKQDNTSHKYVSDLLYRDLFGRVVLEVPEKVADSLIYLYRFVIIARDAPNVLKQESIRESLQKNGKVFLEQCTTLTQSDRKRLKDSLDALITKHGG